MSARPRAGSCSSMKRGACMKPAFFGGLGSSAPFFPFIVNIGMAWDFMVINKNLATARSRWPVRHRASGSSEAEIGRIWITFRSSRNVWHQMWRCPFVAHTIPFFPTLKGPGLADSSKWTTNRAGIRASHWESARSGRLIPLIPILDRTRRFGCGTARRHGGRRRVTRHIARHRE